MTEDLVLRGVMIGHRNWVTAIATSTESPNIIVSASRDKTLLQWRLLDEPIIDEKEQKIVATAERSLHGHSHFVQDVALSMDGNFALSGSWDGTLRLWDLNKGETTRSFIGHSKDVLSVAFSSDNRQIVSGSRDRTIKLWNTLGECKFTMGDKDGHQDWVSCVRFSPRVTDPTVVSCGWDHLVKVWDLNKCRLRVNLVGHTGYLNTVTVSPDGSLCASGGRDGKAMLWDLQDNKQLYELNANDTIHCLVFSPNRYWLCAATTNNIIIWVSFLDHDVPQKPFIYVFFCTNRILRTRTRCASLASTSSASPRARS